MTKATSSLPELYWKLGQINGAIEALEQIQRAQANRPRPLSGLRRCRRARQTHFQRPSKKPECSVVLPSIPMSA
jgi:hypothetical protein